jgi:hypothetical protein
VKYFVIAFLIFIPATMIAGAVWFHEHRPAGLSRRF